MNNQSKQWFSVTIQVVSEHQELPANRCFELSSNGITFTDTAITAYFSARTNPESVIQELHTYCGSQRLLIRTGLKTGKRFLLRQQFKLIKQVNKNSWTAAAFRKNND